MPKEIWLVTAILETDLLMENRHVYRPRALEKSIHWDSYISSSAPFFSPPLPAGTYVSSQIHPGSPSKNKTGKLQGLPKQTGLDASPLLLLGQTLFTTDRRDLVASGVLCALGSPQDGNQCMYGSSSQLGPTPESYSRITEALLQKVWFNALGWGLGIVFFIII